MRFHLLSLFHTISHKMFSPCAFSIKVIGLSKMLTELGHEVIHYGTEGAELVCSEHVNVLDYETYFRLEGHLDWKRLGFNPDTSKEIYRIWTDNSIKELRKRIKHRDFLLCTFGLAHVEQARACPEAVVVESGIGYPSGFANFQIFESYAWRNIYYGGDERRHTPRCYDTVIPNYLDMKDYPYVEEKKDYAIFLGRPIPKKGSAVASDACKAAGIKLYVAGQGGLLDGVDAEYLGVLGIEERAKWVSEAKCLICPTHYVEPFGTVTIEAMAMGTPVISSDFGVFNENVLQGYTGFRCSRLKEYVWALQNIDQIKPINCRKFAEQNFSMEVVGKRYEDYFRSLEELHAEGSKGFYELDNPVNNLDYIKRYYPFGE